MFYFFRALTIGLESGYYDPPEKNLDIILRPGMDVCPKDVSQRNSHRKDGFGMTQYIALRHISSRHSIYAKNTTSNIPNSSFIFSRFLLKG